MGGKRAVVVDASSPDIDPDRPIAAGLVVFRRLRDDTPEYLLLRSARGSNQWSPPKVLNGSEYLQYNFFRFFALFSGFFFYIILIVFPFFPVPRVLWYHPMSPPLRAPCAFSEKMREVKISRLPPSQRRCFLRLNTSVDTVYRNQRRFAPRGSRLLIGGCLNGYLSIGLIFFI
jgi:hypothetical protein